MHDVVDDAGALADSLTYDSFGNLTAETTPGTAGRYLWTAREFDVETGLQFNRARYYDAETGRWISQDPLGFDAGDSNLYRYVSNRTLEIAAPSGLLEVDDNPTNPIVRNLQDVLAQVQKLEISHRCCHHSPHRIPNEYIQRN